MTISFSGFTKSYDKNCFREHILESIAINKERKFAYSQLTNGRTDRIFNLLIGSEYLSLVPARYYDMRAAQFQKKGMSLFCHEFMSMNRVSEFDPEKRIIPSAPREPFDWGFHKKRLGRAIEKRNVEMVKAAAITALEILFKQPEYHCMSRHIVESIYRFAYFIPLRQQEAKSLGAKSPDDLMWDVTRLHLLGMGGSYEIDEWSGPIQEEGIPVLCSEIPDLLHDLEAPELKQFKLSF